MDWACGAMPFPGGTPLPAGRTAHRLSGQEGHGAAGLEAALDDVLYTGERDTLHCAVTAQGRLQRGSEPILEKADSAPQGVRLTLSRSIQRAAEGVAAESMATGCVLITDVSSGKVRACVSLPGFDAAKWARV